MCAAISSVISRAWVITAQPPEVRRTSMRALKFLAVVWLALGAGCEDSGSDTQDGLQSGSEAASEDSGAGEQQGEGAGEGPGPGSEASGDGGDESIELVVLGDSLTEGIGDTEYTDAGVFRGYPDRLRTRLAEAGRPASLTNLGKSGWTSTDMNQGLDWGDGPQNAQLPAAVELIQSAVGEGRTAVACVWIGSNDLFGLYGWCHEPDNEECEAENLNVFRANVQTAVADLRAAGATVFVALLDDQSKRPVLADPAYDDVLPDIDDASAKLMSAQVSRYNAAISEIANQEGAVTVDFFSTTLFETTTTLDPDGVHPNAAGYEQITDRWEAAIIEALGL
jgi:lysophospholipase L1-like esterase